MPSLLEQERALYQDVWTGFNEQYGSLSPGEHHVAMFLDAIHGDAMPRYRTLVLDAGCGSGKGAIALKQAGFDVLMCDLTNAGLVEEAKGIRYHDACMWEPLAPQLGYLPGGGVDYVFCSDVLEHIPPQFTMLAVSRLLEVARKGVFLTISLREDIAGNWVGRSLHQTVPGVTVNADGRIPFTWWRDSLATLGEVVDARDLLGVGVYLVKPRC